MKRKWVPLSLNVVAVAVVALSLVAAPARPRTATAIGSVAKPYVLSTPLFTPKDGSNSTLTFASMEDVSVVLNLRRYNAVGGLLSSTNFALGAKSSIIAFAGANSGAQMHIEIWSPTPFFTMEMTYTNPSSVVNTIPYGNMLKPRTGTGFLALDPFRACDTRVAGNACPVGALGPGQEVVVALAGVGGVPAAGASAVTVNLMAIGGAANSLLKVWPDGAARPSSAAIIFGAHQTLMNMITVKLGSNGNVRVFNAAGNANVVMELAGYYA